MPARIKHTQRLSTSISSQLSSSQQPPSFLSCTYTSSPSSPSSTIPSISSRSASSSSTRTRRPATKFRQDFLAWLNGPGAAFKQPLPDSTNYLSAYDRKGELRRQGSDRDAPPPPEELTDLKPFPLNPYFVSENVLSEELRNKIYEEVVEQKKSLRTVSILYGVDLRRVGAVARLVALEKKMKEQNKERALPYGRAVMQMLPTSKLAGRGEIQKQHESINDLPVHRLTEEQIFYPTSESRQFNRVDAGRVFSGAPARPAEERDEPGNTPEAIAKVTREPGRIELVGKGTAEEQVLQPAEMRIPHPHLVASEYDKIHNGKEQLQNAERFLRRIDEEDMAQAKRRERQKEKQERTTTRVEPEENRYEYRFRDAVVSRETTGSTGRGIKAPGRRYGVPTTDRKRGAVKIPTKVEV